MTGRRGSRTDDDGGPDPIVEIIDLEPTDPRSLHRDSTAVRRRRWPAAIAIVVLVALTGSVIVNRTHGSKGATRDTPTTNARSTNLDFGQPGEGTAMFPFRVGAQVLTGGASGLRLGDTDTGAVTDLEIVGLPLGPATIVAESGGTVAVRIGADLYWFTMETRAAHSVADSIGVATAFPSARRGSLWFAGARSAIEVPDGRTPIPTPGPAIGATSAGLLVDTKAGVLLQPTTGQNAARMLLRAPATVIGVHADRVAWVGDECGVLRCPVHVTEVPSGATSDWLQLGGRDRASTITRASAAFSPDGSHLAIIVPGASGRRVATLVMTDLHTRATSSLDATGRVDIPAQPGSHAVNGTTLAWTVDGTYLVLAPAVEAIGDRIGVVDPATAVIVAGRANLHVGSSVAAVGVSTTGPLDLPRHGDPGPVDSSAATQLHLPGLSLVGVDDYQFEALDLGSNVATRDPVFVTPGSPGPHTIARVTGGWLVVRGRGVESVPDANGGSHGGLVDAGSLVFSANHGRDAWIAIATGSAVWHVEPYDPATGTIGTAVAVGTPVGAVDQGLVVTVGAANGGTNLDLVDRSSTVRHLTVINSGDVHVLATGGNAVAYTDGSAFKVLDASTGLDRLVEGGPVAAASLSPDGTALAWIDGTEGGPTVRAMRVGSTTSALVGSPADRVLVADDGTVLLIQGVDVWRGRIGENGSSRVSGLAPEAAAALALG